MEVNETIISGKKIRICIDAINKLWERISIWSKASDVEFDDGRTAETKVGMINGITSDPNCEDETIAISAKAFGDLSANMNSIKPPTIDINNILYSITNNGEYVATEDYIICGMYLCSYGAVYSMALTVNNIEIAYSHSRADGTGADVVGGGVFYIGRAGDIIKNRGNRGIKFTKVYGLLK